MCVYKHDDEVRQPSSSRITYHVETRPSSLLLLVVSHRRRKMRRKENDGDGDDDRRGQALFPFDLTNKAT
jgi:hypothetical protein